MATQSTTNKNNRQTSSSYGRPQAGGRPQRNENASQESFLARGNEQLRDLVEDHEGQTVLAALALGFGIGIVIGYSLGGGPEPKERWTDRIAAEGVGRRLLARIDSLLPESISSKFA